MQAQAVGEAASKAYAAAIKAGYPPKAAAEAAPAAGRLVASGVSAAKASESAKAVGAAYHHAVHKGLPVEAAAMAAGHVMKR